MSNFGEEMTRQTNMLTLVPHWESPTVSIEKTENHKDTKVLGTIRNLSLGLSKSTKWS
jgi:hypothetical protein